jgi:pyrimidine-nucleoside phosphorylase
LDARAFLRAKRDRVTHEPDAIRQFVRACMAGEIPDYQISAWLMAVFLNGLDPAETGALTRAFAESGRTFDWSDLGVPTADKHSTGGVGDKVSLVVAPLVAACGVAVPMVAGRGLGHTGGTVDKLEAIPGFRTNLSPDAMRKQLETLGVVIVGQGPELAPADGLFYALRDVTSTVESQPLIVASIVSKKAAEGAQALIYDVKCGNGAFMRTPDAARDLAARLVENTRAVGRASAALITDMSQPLGAAIGNALEVSEAAEVLQGRGPADVRELTLELGSLMLLRSQAEPTAHEARSRLERALASGTAWQRFLSLVEAQGGDVRAVERAGGFEPAPVVRQVLAPTGGRITAMDTFGLGELSVSIGAGRTSKEQPIDPRVGLVMRARVGQRVEAGEPVAELHLDRDRDDAVDRLVRCVRIGDEPVVSPSLVLDRLD